MYQINKNYRLREEEDGAGLMFNRATSEIYVLNPTAMWIMSLLERKACPLEEVLSEVDGAFEGAEPEQMNTEVTSFVQDSASKGFLEECQA